MDDRNNPLTNAARGRNACGINHDELLGPLEVEIKELKEENEILKKMNKWISVEEMPLIKKVEGGWLTTDAGSGTFIAAVPYNDKRKSGTHWWIRHCVIEDEVGLCIVGDVDNEPAGWEVEDVTHWMPFPTPPKTIL